MERLDVKLLNFKKFSSALFAVCICRYVREPLIVFHLEGINYYFALAVTFFTFNNCVAHRYRSFAADDTFQLSYQVQVIN